MIGVEFDTHERAAAAEWACFQRGLLVLEAGKTVVRISPPLVITAEAAVGLKLFGEAVAEVAAKADGVAVIGPGGENGRISGAMMVQLIRR